MNEPWEGGALVSSQVLCFLSGAPQSLQRELQGHRARVEDVLDRAGLVASMRSPEADCVRAGLEQLRQLWEALRAETEQRQLALDAMYQAQQYYFDVAEVEAWLSEQELHMMNEEKGKVLSESPGHAPAKGCRKPALFILQSIRLAEQDVLYVLNPTERQSLSLFIAFISHHCVYLQSSLSIFIMFTVSIKVNYVRFTGLERMTEPPPI